ncbi:MAG: DUF5996 family protein [Actinomycetota bacterium]|nr:DUF5996 family protein [Actinomycetota bacterium]
MTPRLHRDLGVLGASGRHGAPDYDDLRSMNSPETALLEYLESAYLAGAKTAGRDAEAFRTSPFQWA